MGSRVLYVGTTWPGSTTVQRRRALEDLGCRVTSVDTGWRQVNPALPLRVLRGLRRHAGFPMEMHGENAALLEEAARARHDLLWVDKGLTIRPATLAALRRRQPGMPFVSFSADDMANPENQSRYYLKSVGLYDLHVTTKQPNVVELSALGAPKVILVDNGYDPHVHRPLALSAQDRETWGADVAFVGGYERERAGVLVRLAASGVPVRVWGNRWHLLRSPPPLLRLERRPVFGDEYAKVLCASRINLAFLRRANRDTQTTRSVEIPACGAFMLAERTADHRRLFVEGSEAAYFDGFEELLARIAWHLAHEEERLRIAAAGLERCRTSGYRYRERLAPVLDSAGVEAVAPASGGDW